MAIKLEIKTFKQEGKLANEYNPLRNLINDKNEIVDFNTDELGIDLNNPLNIECQPSYDGTVNLIINDDKNPPRIINTRFSKQENDRYKIISRNQLEQTNLYRAGVIDRQTRLFRNINHIPKIDLVGINNTGQLKGGNYTFYIKLADGDTNKTDIVCESGQVTIYKGDASKIKSISGTLLNEVTDKAILLKLSNLDTTFSKFYIYFSREFSDTNGVRMSEAGMFTNPYDIKNTTESILLNGYEQITPISIEDLNIQYNVVSAAKTQTQVQNMLFFGNIQQANINIKDLQNISYFLSVTLKQDENGVGWVNPENYTLKNNADLSESEYYNPLNLYYKVGYWPDEMYRLGIVYIMNDDTLSPVFNLRGCNFKDVYETTLNADCNNLFGRNNISLYDKNGKMQYLDREAFLTGGKFLDNTYGVFKTPIANVIQYNSQAVKPLYFDVEITDEIQRALSELHVKGYFIVRQKRIPTIVSQGFSIGVDNASYIPMVNYNGIYEAECFLTKSGVLSQDFNNRVRKVRNKQCSGLLCIDANVNKVLQSNFDGSDFILQPLASGSGTMNKDSRHYWLQNISNDLQENSVTAPIVFVNSNVPLKFANGFSYATRCGSGEDLSQISFLGNVSYAADNYDLVRGIYCPFLGVGTSLKDSMIYNIKVPNFSSAKLKDYFKLRGESKDSFFAVSDRQELVSGNTSVYRGDCYSNTVTIRMNRNFVDSDVPVSEHIMDNNTWKDNYKGYNKMKQSDTSEKKDDEKHGFYENMNRADINSVNLGMWITYKCLSNYNLGLRSEDPTHTDEYALMGSPRAFYPYDDMSPVVSHKIEESWLLNLGYSATVGQKRIYPAANVPYIQELFDSRVMFSDVQAVGDFKNAYRIFQGLDYKDIDRQYGAIVKFVPNENNIFCVFEHGLGIIPINEKALLATQSGQSIHMYGAGVLQNQISLVSPDFGSIWPESIIRTPIGVYGVDTSAKKIWRYTSNGLEIISDMKIQKFLNDNIDFKEQDKNPIIALKNVKSHYNNYKGDVMFTFYNSDTNKTWNLCFNERMNKWITRYTWTPLYSENINNIFYSLDQSRAKILSYIYNNKHCSYGIRTDNNNFIVNDQNSTFETNISLFGDSIATLSDIKIKSIETSYLDENNKEIELIITDTSDIKISDLFTYANGKLVTKSYSEILTKFETLGINYIPLWYKLNVSVKLNLTNDKKESNDYSFDSVIGVVVAYVKDNGVLPENTITTLEKVFLQNGFYVHGRAGVFDEIDYTDESFDNQILPTKWYDRQEPFEFEFVVNDQLGIHKIFNNLVIISNNVQPNQIEYTIEGDVYNFNKAGIYRANRFKKDSYLWDPKYNKPIKTIDPKTRETTTYQATQNFTNCKIEWDTTLNSYYLTSTQDCKNIENAEYGRRRGNIQYKEDSWYLNIEPIRYNERFKINTKEEQFIDGKEKSVRVRDKFVKIRVKYTGEDLVVITALKTLFTLSYA